MPPIDASAPGSIGKNRPVSRISRFNCVDPQHPVHARDVQADAAFDEQQMPFQRRACAVGNHRHAVLVRQADHERDLLGALGEHHRIRRRHVERRLVAAVLFTQRQRGRNARAEAGLQGLQHGLGHRARRAQAQGVIWCVHRRIVALRLSGCPTAPTAGAGVWTDTP